MTQNHEVVEIFEGMELIEEVLLNNINGAGPVPEMHIASRCVVL
jgi:hypothetical protein